MQLAGFYILGFLVLAPAVSIIFIKNVIYSVYWLVLCLLAIAGLFFLAGAEFVAVTQIIIYAGGMLVLLVFGIMLTNRIKGQKIISGFTNLVPGLLTGLLFLVVLVTGLLQVDLSASLIQNRPPAPGLTGTQSIGIELMTGYVLPFEIAGLLLLIALVGASLLAWKNFGIKKDDTR